MRTKRTLQTDYLRNEKSRIDYWILPYFSTQPINEISAADVRKWQGDLKNAVNQNDRPLSPGYMQNIITELSSIFNFAVTFYGLTVNPCRIKGEGVITSPKTEKANRMITLSEFLTALIEAHERRIYGIRPETRLFTVSHSTYARLLETHTALAGVPRIRLHDLRHSHASLLIELGFSALLVSERLGHENVSTILNIYSHLFPSKQSEVAEKLQSLCKGTPY